MARVHLVPDGGEIARRRPNLAPGQLVEAWPDLYLQGLSWLGEDGRRGLEVADGPLPSALSIDAAHVRVYYGPQLTDVESLPVETSLRARVLSAHGIAVAWITLDQFGERVVHRVESPRDAVFFLRCPGGAVTHQWRLFQTRGEAIRFMNEHYPRDREAQEWAADLSVESYDDLLARHARAESDAGV